MKLLIADSVVFDPGSLNVPEMTISHIEVPDFMEIVVTWLPMNLKRSVDTTISIGGKKYTHQFIVSDTVLHNAFNWQSVYASVAEHTIDNFINDGVIDLKAREWLVKKWLHVLNGGGYNSNTSGIITPGSKLVPEGKLLSAENTIPVLEQKARRLPGMTRTMGCPECDFSASMFRVIMHRNDFHGTTREKIADWLDDLHDSGEVNIEFSPWNEESVPIPDNEQVAENMQTSYKIKGTPIHGDIKMKWGEVTYYTATMSQPDISLKDIGGIA